MNSNHKKRWTKREKQQLLEHAKQAKINKLSPVEFCHKSAPDFGREPEGLFLQLSNLGLLSSEVKWSSLFSTLWQLGHYETISWLGLKEVELMAFNDSHLKLVPFKYPQEDKEELSKLFRQALDKSSPQSWLGVENGPTGLGKTHYMTYEIIKAINDHLSDKKRPKLSIILVAPQHRHLDEIKTNLEKCFQFENRLNVIKAGSVIDMLQSQQEYLPADCPYNNDDDKRNNPAKAILKQMESFLPKKEHHQSQPIGYSIGLLINDLRNKLRKQCKKIIETTLFEQHLEPLMCQQCRFMHIGKVMFNETNKCRVSITFSTYDKLFYGFDTYRINRKKQCYVREFFSPWVSEKTGNLKPIKNAVIFMEESTAGFNILWKKIQESQLKINLTELVSYLYNNFRSHSSKTLSAIHHDNSESTKTFFKKQQQEIKKTLAIMEKLYIQVNDNKIPIFGNNQSIQFKCQDKKNIHQILQSTELFFSDLFSERTIAYQAKQQIELNTIVANIWIADRKQNFLDSGTHSVFPLAFYYLKLGVKSVIEFLQYFKRSVQKIDEEVNYFELALNHIFSDSNESSRNKREYFYKKVHTRKLPTNSIKNELFYDAMDLFYLRGYEYMTMPYSHEKDEYYVEIRSCQHTPEGMLVGLLTEKLANRVLLISASAAIDSPLMTHNLQWLRKIGIEPKIRAVDSLAKIIAHKYEKRAKPTFSTSKEFFFRKDDHNIIVDSSNEMIKQFLQEELLVHPKKWFVEGENPFHTVIHFLEDLLNNKEQPKPRYALFLCNNNNHAQNAIELVKKFFTWIKEKTEIDMGIELGEAKPITAKDFKNFADEEDNDKKNYSKINKTKEKIIEHLFSTEKPKLFLIAGTYQSIAIGANLQLQIAKEKFETASSHKNLELYLGDEKELRFFEGDSPTIDIDMSDILLAVAKTYIIDENNDISSAHILAINNDVSFKLLAKGILDQNQEVWQKISGVVKKTQDFHLFQFNNAMQAIGRMDRSFNIPARSKIYLSHEVANSLQEVANERIENVIYTKTFNKIRKYYQNQVRSQLKLKKYSRDNVGAYMTRLVNAGFDANNPQQSAIQELWHKLRQFFAHHMVLSEITMQNHPDIINIKDKYKQFKGTKFYWNWEQFFYKIPYSAVKIETSFDKKHRIIEFYLITTEDKYLYGRNSLIGNNARKQSYFSEDEKIIEDKEIFSKNSEFEKYLWLLKPDMFRDVAIPAFDEEKTKQSLRMQGYSIAELPPELFEVADIYVPECQLLIDNKSYSQERFEQLQGDKLEEIICKARQKIEKAYAFYQQPNLRLAYVTRNWWSSLNNRNISLFCIAPGSMERITKKDENFDVAFLTTQHNQDYTLLYELIERVKKLNNKIG